MEAEFITKAKLSSAARQQRLAATYYQHSLYFFGVDGLSINYWQRRAAGKSALARDMMGITDDDQNFS